MASRYNQHPRSPLKMPSARELSDILPLGKDLRKTLLECVEEKDRSNPISIKVLPRFTANLPSFWMQYPEQLRKNLMLEMEDRNIRCVFEREKLINWTSSVKLMPLFTAGDGNCLLHAASLYMWGIDDSKLFLRKLLHKTLNHIPFAKSIRMRWQKERSTQDMKIPDSGFRYNTREWDAEFQMVISMSDPNHGSTRGLIYPCLEEFHIFTLANIIRRPIIVLASDTLRGPTGQSIQPLHVAGIYLPVLWDPSLCFKHPVVLGFYQNHFFPLVATQKENAGIDFCLPLASSGTGMKPLPLKFLDMSEEQRCDDLKNRYLFLDDIINTSGPMSTACPVAAVRLGEEVLEKQFNMWVSYFQLAEQRYRMYMEEEYNPENAEKMKRSFDLRNSKSPPGSPSKSPAPRFPVSNKGVRESSDTYAPPNQQYQYQFLNRDDHNLTKGPGPQCITPGCPYLRSANTKEYCNECFKKNQDQLAGRCTTSGCLNPAEAGQNICGVCSDGKKFKEATGYGSNNRGDKKQAAIECMEEEDRFKTQDLNTHTVNNVSVGSSKCIIPECALTGSVQTNLMCEKCFKEQNEEVQKIQQNKGQPQIDDSFEMLELQELEAARNVPMDDLKRKREELMKKFTFGGGTSSVGIKQDCRNLNGEKFDKMEDSAPLAMAYADQQFTVQKYQCKSENCRGILLEGSKYCHPCAEKNSAEDPRVGEGIRAQQQKLIARLARNNPDLRKRENVACTVPADHGHDKKPQGTPPVQTPRKPDCIHPKCDNPAIPPAYKLCIGCWEVFELVQVESGLYNGRGDTWRKGSPDAYRLGYPPNRSPEQHPAPAHNQAECFPEQEPYPLPAHNHIYDRAEYPKPLPPAYSDAEPQVDPATQRIDNQIRGFHGNGIRDERRERHNHPSEGQRQRDEFSELQAGNTAPMRNPASVGISSDIPRLECQGLTGTGCPYKLYGDPSCRNLCSVCSKESQKRAAPEHKPETARPIQVYPQEETRPDDRMYRNYDDNVQHNHAHRAATTYREGAMTYEQTGTRPAGQGAIKLCVQPECKRQAGRNTEDLCDKCYNNYKQLFANQN